VWDIHPITQEWKGYKYRNDKGTTKAYRKEYTSGKMEGYRNMDNDVKMEWYGIKWQKTPENIDIDEGNNGEGDYMTMTYCLWQSDETIWLNE